MDEWSCARARDVDRHEIELHDIREDYVRRDVYQAALDRLTALERKLNNAWLSNRNALLVFGSTLAGVIATVYLARGGGH